MKKLHLLILAICFSVTISSCYHSGHHVSIIRSDNGGSSMKMEYAGRVVFNKDTTGISFMSPGGYFEYSDNGGKLSAKCDAHGKVIYKVNDDGDLSALNLQGKRLLVEAVNEIEKTHGAKR